jgi:crossover junction endodeoxyribonuclease RusA
MLQCVATTSTDSACSRAYKNLIIFLQDKRSRSLMELSFPIEFLVHGTAVSLQAKRAESKNEWKQRIKAASTAVMPQPHFASQEPIGVTLYYLPDEPMMGDIDNIVKPILDALSAHIYVDDQQVERLVVQKFDPGVPFEVENPSETVVAAVTGPRPVLYVRLSDRPREELR